MNKMKSFTVSAMAICLMMAGRIALAGSINFPLTFAGTAANNWGWESKTDTGSQLGGTNQMTYTYAAANTKSYVFNTITDAATVFPDGTGTVTKHLTVDLSNYPTGAADYYVTNGPTIAEITSAGNQGSFTGGMISQIFVTGSDTAGKYRFGIDSAVHFYSGPDSKTNVMNIGTHPSFPLVYDLIWTVTISGNDAAGWTVTTDLSAQGPVDSVGTIGTVTATNTFTKTGYATFNGWLSATGYAVGDNGVKGSAAGAGNSVTFGAIPEPATLGLLAVGGLLIASSRCVRR